MKPPKIRDQIDELEVMTTNETPRLIRTLVSPPSWRVWLVEDVFIAANSLEEAIIHYCDAYGRERDEAACDGSPWDHAGFYRSGDEAEALGSPPDCTMREAAEEKLREGNSLPIEVAIAFNH